MEEGDIQEKLDQIYKVIKKLKEKHSKKKIQWLMKISDKEYGLIELLVANFMDNIDQVEYASKILMILKQLMEYCPEIVYDQLVDCKTLPKAIEKYIENTKLDDLAPEAFVLLTEFFKEDSFLDTLEDREFSDKLMDGLTIINKAEYFDAICTILLVRFHAHGDTKDATEEINDETKYFLDKLTTHRAGRMFIEAIIHLFNRRGSEGFRTINCLTHIITYQPTYDKVYTNDMNLLIDIASDVADKNMTNEQGESLVNMIYQIVMKDDGPNKIETIKETCKSLNSDPDGLTETAQDLLNQIAEKLD